MKIKFNILMFLIILVFLSSCRFNNKYDVYILNFKPESATIYKEIVKEYRKIKNVKIKVETAASGRYEETLIVEMLKSSVPTIFIINGPAGLKSWKDYALNLSNYHNNYKIEMIDNISNEKLLLREKEDIYGLPSTIEGYGLIYNKLVFNEYFSLSNRSTSLKSMEEIKSFNELEMIVKDLNEYIIGKKTYSNCPNMAKLKRVFSLVSLKSGSDWPYQTHLSSVAMFYEFNELGNEFLGIDTKTIKFKYNMNMKKMFDLYLEYSNYDKNKLGDVSYDDSLNSFINGSAAIIQQGNWIASTILNDENTKLGPFDIGMIPIYMGVKAEEKYGIAIGTENYFAVNKTCTKKQIKESVDFLNWLYTSDKGKDYVINALGYIPPYINFEYEFTNLLNESIIKYMNDKNLDPVEWSFNYYPTESFKTDFGGDLLDYALGKKTWTEIVNNFIKRWKEDSK